MYHLSIHSRKKIPPVVGEIYFRGCTLWVMSRPEKMCPPLNVGVASAGKTYEKHIENHQPIASKNSKFKETEITLRNGLQQYNPTIGTLWLDTIQQSGKHCG